jgi:hypothetical protein
MHSPVQQQLKLNKISNRIPDIQQQESSYPCLATNLGLYKLCIHINLNENHPRALIYDFNDKEFDNAKVDSDDEYYEDENEKEEFFGFIIFKDIYELGLDLRNIQIDQSS